MEMIQTRMGRDMVEISPKEVDVLSCQMAAVSLLTIEEPRLRSFRASRVESDRKGKRETGRALWAGRYVDAYFVADCP
jgi:hypothetical protein